MIRTSEEGWAMLDTIGKISKILIVLLSPEESLKFVRSKQGLDTEDRLNLAVKKLKEVTGETDPDKVDLTGKEDFMKKALEYGAYCDKLHEKNKDKPDIIPTE